MPRRAVLRYERAACDVAGGVRVGELDLDVAVGEVVVLAGAEGSAAGALLALAHGCGEPAAGRVSVDGQSVDRYDPVQLRRSVGYAAQAPALLHYRPVADSIALVPRALGWDAARVRAAVAAAAALVGLPPVTLLHHPRDLAPGEAQLVALARALAADPLAVVLDRPFDVLPLAAAVPLAAGLRRIAAAGHAVLLATTVPDVMLAAADRVVLVDDGLVGSVTEPLALLRGPLDGALARFLGRQPGLARLRLLRVGDVAPEAAPFVPASADGHRATQLARALGSDWVLVTDERERPCGWAFVTELTYGRPVGDEALRPVVTVPASETLLAALDAIATRRERFLVPVDDEGRAAGILRADSLVAGAW